MILITEFKIEESVSQSEYFDNLTCRF